MVVTDLGGADTSMAVVSPPNGKIVAAGDSFGGPPGFVLVRYLG